MVGVLPAVSQYQPIEIQPFISTYGYAVLLGIAAYRLADGYGIAANGQPETEPVWWYDVERNHSYGQWYCSLVRVRICDCYTTALHTMADSRRNLSNRCWRDDVALPF